MDAGLTDAGLPDAGDGDGGFEDDAGADAELPDTGEDADASCIRR